MVVDLVEVDLHLARTPPGRGGDKGIGRCGATHRSVCGRWRAVILGGLLAQDARGRASLVDERGPALGIEQAIHLGEPLEGVLAVEDPGQVDGVGLGSVGVQRS
jgi:hypothetical protein